MPGSMILRPAIQERYRGPRAPWPDGNAAYRREVGPDEDVAVLADQPGRTVTVAVIGPQGRRPLLDRRGHGQPHEADRGDAGNSPERGATMRPGQAPAGMLTTPEPRGR